MADEMNHHDLHDPHNEGVHHEESDINVRAVIIGIAIVAVLAVIMHVGLWGMYVLFRKIDRSLDPAPSTAITEPAPTAAGAADFTVHWSEPAKYLEVIREDNRKVLEEYGWVNRAAGKVHVPIEVGMKLALERGYPTRQSGTPVTGSGEGEPHPPWVGHQAGTTETGSEAGASSEQPPAEVSATGGDEQAAGGNSQ